MTNHREISKASTAVASALNRRDAAQEKWTKADKALKAAQRAVDESKAEWEKAAGYPWPEEPEKKDDGEDATR